MLRPSPNHGTLRLLNNDDDDDMTKLVDCHTMETAIFDLGKCGLKKRSLSVCPPFKCLVLS